MSIKYLKTTVAALAFTFGASAANACSGCGNPDYPAQGGNQENQQTQISNLSTASHLTGGNNDIAVTANPTANSAANNTATLTGGDNTATASSAANNAAYLTGGNNAATLTANPTANSAANNAAYLTGGNNTATGGIATIQAGAVTSNPTAFGGAGGNGGSSSALGGAAIIEKGAITANPTANGGAGGIATIQAGAVTANPTAFGGNAAGGASSVKSSVSGINHSDNTNIVGVNTAGTVGNVNPTATVGNTSATTGASNSDSKANAASNQTAKTGSSTSGASTGPISYSSYSKTEYPRQTPMAYSANVTTGIPSADCSMTTEGTTGGISSPIVALSLGQTGKKVWNEDSDRCGEFAKQIAVIRKTDKLSIVAGIIMVVTPDQMDAITGTQGQALMRMYNDQATVTYTTEVVPAAPVICANGNTAKKVVETNGSVVFKCDR